MSPYQLMKYKETAKTNTSPIENKENHKIPNGRKQDKKNGKGRKW